MCTVFHLKFMADIYSGNDETVEGIGTGSSLSSQNFAKGPYLDKCVSLFASRSLICVSSLA